MAGKYFPFRSEAGDRKYSAEDWAAYFALFIGNGVFYGSADKLKVAEDNGMKVKIQKGAGFIAGRMYLLEEDLIIKLDTADGVLNRIDRIVLRCDYANRLMTVTAKKGGYNKNPTAPELTRNADVYELALADVYVAAGAVTITAANITDQRFNTSLCGIVTGLIDQADTEEIFSQFQAYLEEFKETSQEDFKKWFEYVKAVFDEDATGNLLKQIEVERARIDALTKMEEGSTTGDAELQDIRIGADGVTYGTAGAAVRGQFLNVENELKKKSGRFLYNMCSRANIIYEHAIGASTEKQEERVIITSTTTYGAYYKGISNKNAPVKKFYFIARFKALESSVFPFSIKPVVYFYDSDGKNLGFRQSNFMTVEQSGTYILRGIITVDTEDMQNCSYMETAPILEIVGAKIEVKDYILLDVSNVSNDVIGSIDFEEYMTDGYFDYVKNIDAAYVAEKAIMSDKASISDVAVNAIQAKVIVDELPIITEDEVGGLACTIDSVTEGVITATATVTYGAPYIKYPVVVGRRYLVVWTGDEFSSVGFMKNNGQSWNNYGVNSVVISDKAYYYSVIVPVEDDILKAIYWNRINVETKSFMPVIISYIADETTVDDDYIILAVTETKYNIAIEIKKIKDDIESNKNAIENQASAWKGKKVLFLGDSLTEVNRYQDTVVELLGIEKHNHCCGGAGLLQIIDGNSEGTITAITADTVADMDLVVLYAGYNNRGTEEGTVGDIYVPDGTGQNTIAGYMQYAINRIYECLESAENLTCKVMIVTVDCAGKYNYIDADGYEEYPSGSGITMETLANIQKAVAQANGLPCCDLWHNSGINKFTWGVYGASKNAVNENYTPYELDSEGNPVSTKRIKYVNGKSYYQVRDGEVVLEEYTGSAPYPYNGDQLHKSAEGYKQIGEAIAGCIIASYGK